MILLSNASLHVLHTYSRKHILNSFMLSTVRLMPLPLAAHRPARFYSTNARAENLIYPESKSPYHQDLPSYLEYASRNHVDPTSTTYVGTHYEYTVMASLERFGMSLKRIGGASDYGIDLLEIGLCLLLHNLSKFLFNARLFIVDLVKPVNSKGPLLEHRKGGEATVYLAFLSRRKAPRSRLGRLLGKSRWPMGYIFCKSDGKILQMIWNRRAEQEGLDGLSVGVKYLGGDITDKEVILTYEGKVLND